MNVPEHRCSEHLDEKCRCTICGRTKHFFIDDDDGTFAASGKVAHAICIRCGYEERYYSDTGTVIDGGWYGNRASEEIIRKVCQRWGHYWIGDRCERCGAIREEQDHQ